MSYGNRNASMTMGLFDTTTVQRHPSTAGSELFQEYRDLGETKFLEQKSSSGSASDH